MNINLRVLIVCSLGIQVKAGFLCELAVRRYHECKHLKMKLNGWRRYEIDTSIPNNELNESFYNSTLGSATFDTAMDLQRDIYFSVTNLSCSTELCRCARAIGINYTAEARVGFVFRDEKIYSQFKQAIMEFGDEFVKENFTSIFGHSPIPLESFCSKYDILTGHENTGILSDFLNGVLCTLPNEDQVCAFLEYLDKNKTKFLFYFFLRWIR